MIVLIIVIGAFLFLIGNEVWWRKKQKPGEINRKFVHATASAFAAFSPFYLSWNEIRILSLAALIVIAISKKTKIFKALHSVERSTWGELLFAASIGLLTFITHDKYIYTAALLQMTLADSVAAIVGSSLSAKTKHRFLSKDKSIEGSLAFFIMSSVILLVYGLVAPGIHPSPGLLVIAVVLTLLENVSVYGLDNITVPVIAALLLRF